jgi:hypothetical protein
LFPYAFDHSLYIVRLFFAIHSRSLRLSFQSFGSCPHMIFHTPILETILHILILNEIQLCYPFDNFSIILPAIVPLFSKLSFYYSLLCWLVILRLSFRSFFRLAFDHISNYSSDHSFNRLFDYLYQARGRHIKGSECPIRRLRIRLRHDGLGAIAPCLPGSRCCPTCSH